MTKESDEWVSQRRNTSGFELRRVAGIREPRGTNHVVVSRELPSDWKRNPAGGTRHEHPPPGDHVPFGAGFFVALPALAALAALAIAATWSGAAAREEGPIAK